MTKNKVSKNKISELYECLKNQYENPDTQWTNSKNEWLKTASTTNKGNFGQGLTCGAINELLPFCKAEIIDGGIGDYDIQVSLNQTEMQHVQMSKLRIEHKLATLDVNGCFQFNGISKSKEYDIVFGLGVAPNKFFFAVQNKKWVVNNLTTNMTKDGGGYKWTVKQSDCILLTDENFKAKMATVIENVIAMQCNLNRSASDDFPINTAIALSLFNNI